MADSPRRSKTPKKKSWYALVPEQVELSPSRSCSPSSNRSSRSASPASSVTSKSHGILEYSSPSQVSTLEEGLLPEKQVTNAKGNDTPISTSKSEEVRPSGSYASEYFDAKQSHSMIDVTGGITRESFPFEEGAATQESSSSLDLQVEHSLSDRSQQEEQMREDESKTGGSTTDVERVGKESAIIPMRDADTKLGEEKTPPPSGETVTVVTEVEAVGTVEKQKEGQEQVLDNQDEPLQDTKKDSHRQGDVPPVQPEEDTKPKDLSVVSSQELETQVQEMKGDESDHSTDSFDQKYLQMSNEMVDSQLPSLEPEDNQSVPVGMQLFTGKDQNSSQEPEAGDKHVKSSPLTVGEHVQPQEAQYSHQDSQNSNMSGSLSGDSIQDDVKLRGSQVQLPLDLDSLQPLSQRSAAPSRSGVLLTGNQDEIDGTVKRTSVSSSQSVDKSNEEQPASSYIHYPPELQSRPTSGLQGPRDSRLIRPSDLYGTPRGQDLEDSLARKVAQLLLESGQLDFGRMAKTRDSSKVSSKSSSCSGSPDSIEGSLTPSSQKDFPNGRDIFERRDSLNREKTPGRESPASSVSSCTDSLALHVQQLLKESEHLRARAPSRDIGRSSGHMSQTDATNLSGVSTSSSVKRIISRVNAGMPGTDSDMDVEAGQKVELQTGAGPRVGIDNPPGVKRHSVEYRGSTHGSPRSQGRDSPYHSDSGRESPRYLGTSSRESPSHVSISRSNLSQGNQERNQSFERSHATSHGRDALSQRVQNILPSADYVGSASPSYHDGGASELYQRVDGNVGSPSRNFHERGSSYAYQMQDGITGRQMHNTEIGDDGIRRFQQVGARDYSSTYLHPDGGSSRKVQSAEDAEVLARRVQAILMEDAQEDRVDHLILEDGVTQREEDKFKPVTHSNLDSRLASFHTVPSTFEDEHPESVGNFGALERARAVLEQQLQKVSERTFDHSITWETPMKHRRGSDHSHERGSLDRPAEAWGERRAATDAQYGSVHGDESHQRLSDSQLGYYRSESNQRADKRYYSFPSSEIPSVSDQIVSGSGHQASGGARPRSFPQADSSRAPSYHRSQSTPGNQSGIPRRTFPSSATSSGSRTSHGRSSSLGKSSDFTSQVPVSEGYEADRDIRASPPQRPLSATLPRTADRSRRSTFSSGIYAASGSSPPSSTRMSRGTSPERNVLHPYRPPGSEETLYTYPVERGRDRFSSTVNSSTTMESTHTGSDDAQPPDFPTHVFGSRKDPPRKNGSMIPKMLSTDHRAVSAADVKGHVPREPEYSAAIDLTSGGKDLPDTLHQDEDGSRKSRDIPLDLSKPGRRKPGRPIGRTSPSQLPQYRDPVASKRQMGDLDKDIQYARLPSQPSSLSPKSHTRRQEQYPTPAGQKSNIPGYFSRKVLTDVLLDDGNNLAQADDMWRQYQHLKEQKKDEQEAEGISGTSSIDESKIQRLASLIKDPVGHTARNIAQDVKESEYGEREEREEDAGLTSDETREPKTRQISSAQAERTEDYSVSKGPRSTTAVVQGPFDPEETHKEVSPGSEPQPAKRQKTSRVAPSTSGIPKRDMRPKEKIVQRALTPTKRKAAMEEIYGRDVSEASQAEASLSDISLDSEQLLLLLGSHGIKKLSSKLYHLQQRIEKQKEHHRRQAAGGQKGRKPKHVMGKKGKTIPRPSHSSTPAPEPESGLIKDVPDIIHRRDTASSPSTVSSLSGATQRTDDLDSVSGNTSVSTLTAPVREVGRAVKRHETKDDSEVEYRTSEAESEVSVLCSCRPTLRRPRSAQESQRREPENGISRMSKPDEGVFKRPTGVAPKTSSRIPVKDKNNSARIPPDDNRNHDSSPVPVKKFPKGTAFTIDLSQQSEDPQRKETSEEKGVLTDLPEKGQDRRRAVVEKRTSKVVNKENVTPRLTPPGIAWFQPFSKKMPWHEERPAPPRPKPIIISAIQHDPRTGKLSLQDAFLRHRPDFISQCRERQRKMKLAAEERHIQESMELERIRIFEEQKAKKANPLAHPYSDQLHKPSKRNITRKEMKQQTQKIYSRLPEVVRKKEENKKQVVNETNRLRAQIYRKKLSDRLKSRWPSQ